MEYHTFNALVTFVGVELEFETFLGHTKRGVLELDGNKLWLPFCGGVNATTVRVKLPSLNHVIF